MPISKFGQFVADYMANALHMAFPTVGSVATAEPMFQIFVKDLQGKTITINDVKSSDLLQVVFDKAEDKTGVPANEMRLLFAGKQLDVSRTLADYKIVKGATLHLAGRLRGGVGEYAALQQSIQDNITHGNVAGALTKESVIATEAIRSAIELTSMRNAKGNDQDHIKHLDKLIIEQIDKIKRLDASLRLVDSDVDELRKQRQVDSDVDELRKQRQESVADFKTLIENMADDMGFPKSVCQLLPIVYNVQATAECVPIHQVYSASPKLVNLYRQSLLTRGLGAGNCDEMAVNTAIHLIESTRGQWVYRCAISGVFDANIPADAPRNEMGHVFVVTTYTNYGQYLSTNAPDATVVDSWYNNLVCSLEDYMKRLHPYYKYSNVFPNGRELAPHEIEVLDCWEAMGVPFAMQPVDGSQLSETDAISKIASKKKLLSKNLDVDLNAVTQDADFQFDVDNTVVHDVRDTDSLELLLLNAVRTSSALGEVSRFTMASFVEVLKTTNPNVLSILYEALDKVDNVVFLHFLNATTREQWQTYYNGSPERQQGILNRQLSHVLIDEWLTSLEDGLLSTNKGLDIWELD